ncbi:MAG TPA: hypothetical protein VGO01_00075 [Bradyrhizobium sp.]|jgi:hypothetical protein|nr:hypothetical protein [Bradyrhizobium sp.]
MATAPKDSIKAIQFPTPPSNRPSGKPEDLRKHFAEITAKQPVDTALRAAFLENKVLIAHTQPTLDLLARDFAVENLVKQAGPEAEKALTKFGLKSPHPVTPPVPGGVGYGMFYTAPFKVAWGRGTSFACDFVCPTPPGGNVTTFLYLTATNRSSMGVEGLRFL